MFIPFRTVGSAKMGKLTTLSPEMYRFLQCRTISIHTDKFQVRQKTPALNKPGSTFENKRLIKSIQTLQGRPSFVRKCQSNCLSPSEFGFVKSAPLMLSSGPPQAGNNDEKNELKDLYEDINKEITARHPELCMIAGHYFNTQGKGIRMIIATQMARAINYHLHQNKSFILHSQKQWAMACEMVHTASLLHDDVIDISNTRRGKPSVNAFAGNKKAVLAGDYILAKASSTVARLQNHRLTQILVQILENLVHGEFMQMGADEGGADRLTHYMDKTFHKTASLMAYGGEGVAVLGGADRGLTQVAFQYAISTVLDFISSSDTLGKPAAVDLQLGLATAPVLFAAETHPELNKLIERCFSQPGDVEKALDLVHSSDGLGRTKLLAQQYCRDAVLSLDVLKESPYKRSLIELTDQVLNRTK